MLKKDLPNHIADCPLVEVTCADCNTPYKRCNAAELHSEVVCVKGQLQKSQKEAQRLNEILEQNAQQHQSTMETIRNNHKMRIEKHAQVETSSGNSNA